MFTPENESLSEIHSLIAVMKALSTWSAHKGINECRQACGGLGYSYYSRFPILQRETDIAQTWEGDNTLLLQQTGKYLLETMKRKISLPSYKTITCEWISDVPVEGEVCLAKTETDLLKPKNLIKAFRFKANILLHRAGVILF
mmetsp:Transcript_2375/g.1707  ORF Transcript_2375/g.1707 Transcript_2375/m.1707 type:complete len:143 (+) Transcript_2375:1202-1630(+)